MLKRLTAPVRQYFNSRFSAIHESVTRDHVLLESVVGATGRLDGQLQDSLGLVGRSLNELGSKIDELTDGRSGSSSADGEFLTATAMAFAYRQLSGVAAGSRVLCIGSASDQGAAVLGALGYDVGTAAKPARDSAPVDAVVVLASHGDGPSIEKDDALLEEVQLASRPGTRLVLAVWQTTASGPDEQHLADLLPDWEVGERVVLTRTAPGRWHAAGTTSDLTGDHFLLLTADRTAGRA